MSTTGKKRRLTVIDIFIIFTVLAVLAAGGLYLYNKSAPEVVEQAPVTEEYIITYESKGMSEKAANMLKKGTAFYMTGGETPFGVLEDDPKIVPAKISVELANGEYKTDLHAAENGNNTKRDVTGAIRVKGCRNSEGLFYVEGKLYIAPNMPVTVFSNDMSFAFTVTGIEKVS